MEIPSVTLTIKKPTIDKYVRLVSTLFDLTDTEIEIVSRFILIYRQNPDKHTFATRYRKEIAKELSKNGVYINNYILLLKRKNAIIKNENDVLELNPIFKLDVLPESILFKMDWRNAG